MSNNENEFFMLAEGMNSKKNENTGKIEYYPTHSPLDLNSYYLIISLPSIMIKEEFKSKLKLTWNIRLLRNNFIKEVQILESNILYATYTSEYFTIMEQNDYNPQKIKELNFPSSENQFSFYISLYFGFLEKIINLHREKRKKFTYHKPDYHIIDKYKKTKGENIYFSISFEKEIEKYLILDVLDKNLPLESLKLKDIMSFSKENLTHPSMIGNYIQKHS